MEADIIKQVGVDEKIKNEYLRSTRKQLETKLYNRNLMKGINTREISLVRYLGQFLRWTREELQEMDPRRRKLMTINKALHPRNHIDRLNVSRKEEGRRLPSIEDRVDISIRRLKDNIKKEQRKTNYSDQKQQNQQKDQQKNNIYKTKMERKKLWTFHVINKWNLTPEDFDITMKGKP